MKDYGFNNVVLAVCQLVHFFGFCCAFRNMTIANIESAELVSHYESSLSLPDILPIPSKNYDKNRAPKLLGQPTVVYFHVTVLSLDSINEESMLKVGEIHDFDYQKI